MQFLFLIGRFFKIFSSDTAWPNEPKLFGQTVSRGRILKISQSETKVTCGVHVC
jgi:hypothetical protein